MKKRWIAAFITIIFFTLSAQATWEGSTAVSLHGELPEKGLYAASNAFPRNTVVEISNPATGQTAKVTITERLTAPGLFLLVSKTAADALGMDYEDIIPAKAVIIDRRADTVSLYEEDMTDSTGLSGTGSDNSETSRDDSLNSIMADLYPDEEIVPEESVTAPVAEAPPAESSSSFLMPELLSDGEDSSDTEIYPEDISGEVVAEKEKTPLIRIEETIEPEPKEEIISKGTLNYKGSNGEKTPEKLLPSSQEIVAPDMALVFDDSEPVDVASWEETDSILNIPVEDGDKDFSKATIAVSDSPLFFPDTEADEPGTLVKGSEISEEKASPSIVKTDIPAQKPSSKAAGADEKRIVDNQIPEKVVPSPVLRPLEPVRLFNSSSVYPEDKPDESLVEAGSDRVMTEPSSSVVPEKTDNSMSLFEGLEDILDSVPAGKEAETVYREPVDSEDDFFISRDVIVEPDILETPEDEEYEEEYAEITMLEEPMASVSEFEEDDSLFPDEYEEFSADDYDDSSIFIEEEPVLTLMEAESRTPSADGDEKAFSIEPLVVEEEPSVDVIDDYTEEAEVAFLLEPSTMKPPEPSMHKETPVPGINRDSSDSTDSEKSEEKDILPDFLASSDFDEEETDKFPKTASLTGLDDSSHEKLENAVVSSLGKGEYLQIGAFSQSKPLLKNYERISSTFPLSLVPVEKNEKVLYKLLVGPLNEDEKGLILIQFRDMGYKDAFFIRR